VPDSGRIANRVIATALIVSLAATILLIIQNNELFGLAAVATVVFALALTALPSILFGLRTFRRTTGAEPPAISRGMRAAVTFSSICLIVVGALWTYFTREGAILVRGAGAAFVAFGILMIVRAWRTAALADQGRRLEYGGSMAVGVLFVFLAAVSIPKFACGCGGTKEKAYVAQMKSDLRNLLTAEEAYFSDSLRYGTKAEVDYLTTSGVTLVDLVARDTLGFYAYVRHSSTAQECGIWMGLRPADGMHKANEGEPTCWPAPGSD
jgi:hypothetical protein